MFTDKDKERRRAELPSGNQQSEAYMPDEILTPQKETGQRVGEVIWPNDRAGEIVRLGDEVARLRQNQLMALNSFQNGLIPSQFPMHDEVAKKYNEVQMQQLDAMQQIIEAQKQAKLNETKAGNINAAKEVSDFNRERVLEYSKTGAKSIGFAAKYLAKGTLEVGKIIGEGLVLTAVGAGKLLFALWGMGKDFNAKYPNKTDI